MSVGLLAVRLLHRFYVRVHFSKWFTLRFVFSRLFVSVRSFATLAPNVLRLGEGGDFYHKC